MASVEAKAAARRRELAKELVQLRRDNEAVYRRETELEAALKKAAADLGENFGEMFEGLGTVRVSAPKDKRCKGNTPELVIDAYNQLTDRQRETLQERGVIVVTEQWTRAYGGRVEVDLF